MAVPRMTMLRVRDWHDFAFMLCGLVRSFGRSTSTRLGGVCPLERCATPPSCRTAICPKHILQVDFAMGLSLRRSCPSESDVYLDAPVYCQPWTPRMDPLRGRTHCCPLMSTFQTIEPMQSLQKGEEGPRYSRFCNVGKRWD